MSNNINKDLEDAITTNDTNMFKEKLLEIGADKISKKTWKFIISKIIKKNMGELLIFLLEKTQISLHDNFYSELFFDSCMHCPHYDIIKILIENGLDINKQLDGDYSCLIEGQCCVGNYEVVKSLIENGADVNVGLYWAIRIHHDNIVQLLLDNGADVNMRNGEPLFCAAGCGNINIIKLLLASGVNIELSGERALIQAIHNGHENIVKLLMELGINIGIRTGEKALLQAAYLGNENAVKFLIKRGIDINTENCLALTLAIMFKKLNMVELLLKNGIDVEIFNSNKTFATQHDSVAAEENNKIFAALQESGIDPFRVIDLLWGNHNMKKINFE